MIDQSKITGVCIFSIERTEDERGWLMELFRNDQLLEEHQPEMSYISMTLPGIIRGPHEHEFQSDIFAFIGPGDFEVHLWERRVNEDEYPINDVPLTSDMLRERHYIYHEKHRFGRQNPAAIIVPPGIVHAYKNISEEYGYTMNFPNQLYGGPGKKYPIDEMRYEEKHSSLFQLD